MSTREKLVAVAGKLFAESGFDGVSLRELTAEAGTNLGAVTYHFGSKEALFGEVVVRKIAKLKELGRTELL